MSLIQAVYILISPYINYVKKKKIMFIWVLQPTLWISKVNIINWCIVNSHVLGEAWMFTNILLECIFVCITMKLPLYLITVLHMNYWNIFKLMISRLIPNHSLFNSITSSCQFRLTFLLLLPQFAKKKVFGHIYVYK